MIGIGVGGLAIAFAETTDKGVDQVLFSGQDALAPLVADAATWSLSALALLIVFKGLAYALSLGSFRGGPTFPAMFLGAAAGLMASQLPGLRAHAGGRGRDRRRDGRRAQAAALRGRAGDGAHRRRPVSAPTPLIIVGVVVAYLVTLLLAGPPKPEPAG